MKTVVSNQGNGFAVRLVPEDFEDEEQLEEALAALVEFIEVPRNEVDMLIDVGTVADMRLATLVQMHRANLLILPTIDEWRTLTVVAGAFPLGLGPLARGTWNQVPRTDWLAWCTLTTGHRKPSRLPAYGDYTIAHPDLPPTGRATILAQLRYATPDAFLIWKGHNVFRHVQRFRQFYGICSSLIARPEYRGQQFSAGDAEIAEKAANQDSPGNAETWRRIGANHHIETVMDQIASLPSP